MIAADTRFDLASRLARVPEIDVAPSDLDAILSDRQTPFVVRGLVADWPLVQAGQRSGAEARDYIVRHDRGMPVIVSVGDPRDEGRLFYDDAMAMNFRSTKQSLPEVFSRIAEMEGHPEGSTIYLSSLDLGQFFDGLKEATPIDLGARECLASIWIGTRTRVAAHNDFPHNLACCAVGRRRFALFPPDQFANLYLGPLDNTPAGRAISMVDFAAPDFAAHPRFEQALQHGMIAELGPGDAIFIPSMWWHHVEGLDPFNVLVNFWWRDNARYRGQPQDALIHAILAIRDLPENERAVWRELFEHYVFSGGDAAREHIPAGARGVLGPIDAAAAGRIRSFLLRALSQ